MKKNVLKLNNSKGEVFYGMHFYPGVAQYEEPGEAPYRVFINESTIREMGPSFTGRPVFVRHVNEVDESLDDLRGEADGWVVQSFFNQADGKTWVKFLVTSEKGLEAIRRGWRLSNAYIANEFDKGGEWNGVSYIKEVTGGEFEHLAIVDNPRYDESIVLTPEEFKMYNESKEHDLKRFANSKRENTNMSLKLFTRKKVENAADLENTMVELPLSKKEISITKLVTDHDKYLNMNGYANGDHMVKVGDSDEMSVNDLVKKHIEACNEIEKMKANADGGEPGGENDEEDESEMNSEEDVEEGMDDVGDRGGDDSLDNEADDEDDADEPPPKKDKKKNSMSLEHARKIIAKEKAAKLKNANRRMQNSDDREMAIVDLPMDQVARGIARYGSGK